ncbi:enoyl-CoA hydratase/isomerase family protein [Corynebacterium pseudopelargi]|nr:enoyl-CoA hydratase/isomerase family protein [Corynebacterium pseudopelargi]
MSEALVLSNIRNNTGHLQLNRPKALNSLNQAMVDIVSDALQQWEHDDAVQQVLITSTSQKGFCAGGDVRAIHDLDAAGKYEQGDEYFAHEYRMNNHLATYSKPIISLIDGVCMGGGIGISAHGSHRVVSERAFASMPEMLIGFVPDVGSTKMLSSMIGQKGYASAALAKFLCITAWRMSPADMFWAGFATHFVPSAELEAFSDMLQAEGIDAALEQYASQPEQESELARYEDSIQAVFDQPHWSDIEAALQQHEDEAFVRMVRKHLQGTCPTSVVAAIELIDASARAKDVREALDNELIMGNALRRTPNFQEGVRAVLIDKTKDAHFVPDSYEQVDAAEYRALLGS